MSDHQDKNSESADSEKTPGRDEESEQDRQLYFEQLAAVHNSILEGVITYW